MAGCSGDSSLTRTVSDLSSAPMSRSGSQRDFNDFDGEEELRDTAPIFPTNSLGLIRSDRREHQLAHPPTTLPMTNTPRRRAQDSGTPATPTVTLSASDLERIIKRAQAPLVQQVAELSKKISDMAKQTAKVDSTVSSMDKKNKDIMEAVDKKKAPLGKLLSHHGSVQLKSLCMQNLQVQAHSPEENNVLEEFLNDAEENNYILHQSAKAINDIKLRFRDERHAIKQQLKSHLKLDLGGQGRPDMAAELSKTKAWITRHVGDMSPEVELVMYHMGFILAKYMNSKKVMVDDTELKCQKSAKESLFDYLYKRMKKDQATVEDLREKIKNALAGGFKFSG